MVTFRAQVAVLTILIMASTSSALLEGMFTPEFVVEEMKKMYLSPSDEGGYTEELKAIGPQPVVQTTSGTVHGITTEFDQTFYGIPYAEPPIGPLRWVSAWSPGTSYHVGSTPSATKKTFNWDMGKTASLRFQSPVAFDHSDATHNKTYQDVLMCYQIGNFLNRSEDCLVLDIHVPLGLDLSDPQNPPQDRLPVLFSIHGGGFILGSGTWPMFEGRYLSEATNTIIVSINYRLGPFGFLLVDDGETTLEGNQGIKDQQLALQWVQDNIEKFGGDKNQVTIFGESAGAQSTMLHLLSNVSDPLFHRAILQSNPLANHYLTREEALNRTAKMVNFLRCGVIDAQIERDCCRPLKSDWECLMEADSQQITNAMVRLMAEEFAQFDFYSFMEPVRPYIDGTEFEKQPIELFNEGKWQKHKPFILGTNEEELIIVKYLVGFLVQNENIYRGVNELLFRNRGKNNKTAEMISDKYIDTYGPDIEDWAWLLSQEVTDIVFGCSQRALARVASATTESAVYFYQYHHWLDGEDCRYLALCGHSTHAGELPFVYRTIKHLDMIPDPEDTIVMDEFSTYWGGLARTGNPSGGLEVSLGDFPDWPKYEKSTSQVSPGPWVNMRINPDPHLETEYRKDMCDFLDTIGLYMDPVDVPVDPTTTHPPTTKTTATSTSPSVEDTTSGAKSPNGPLARATMVAAALITVIFW